MLEVAPYAGLLRQSEKLPTLKLHVLFDYRCVRLMSGHPHKSAQKESLDMLVRPQMLRRLLDRQQQSLNPAKIVCD